MSEPRVLIQVISKFRMHLSQEVKSLIFLIKEYMSLDGKWEDIRITK